VKLTTDRRSIALAGALSVATTEATAAA
jgi:hypothetical protein